MGTPEAAEADIGPDPVELIALRRQLHQWPELRFTEHRTARIIAQELRGLVEDLQIGVAGTGIVATIDTGRPGPSVLVRADMDAYPVSEQTGLEFASMTAGVSHACGHDVHMTAVIGLLRRLHADPPTRGRITAVFQPAEEIPYGEVSGGREMVARLLSGGLRADAVLGLHCWPGLEAGTIGVDPTIAMAAKTAFEVVLSGRAAHVATPASGRDAVLAAATFVVGLHAAMNRAHDADEMVALNIGTITGGSSQSVVAQNAVMTGTIRTHSAQLMDRMVDKVERLVRATAMQHDLEVAITWANDMPPVTNDPELVRRALKLGPQVKRLDSPPLTTDDFAVYAGLGPCLYFKLGVAYPGRAPGPALHSADFVVDETAITTAVDTLETLTRDLLSEGDLDD